MSITFSPAQRAAILAVGVAGVLMPGLQPQLLGALAVEGRVSESLLGNVATAELLAMGIAAGGAGFVLPVTRLRGITVAAILACIAFDCLTPGLTGAALIAVRAAAGVAEGVSIWIAIGMIVRLSEPARWSGIYLAIQTLAQFLVATLLGLYVVPKAGSAGGFIALAIATSTGLIAVAWLPRAYAPLAGESGDRSAKHIPPRGYVALAGVLLYLAFVVSVWVYVEPLAHRRGVDAASVALIAPLSLAMQVAGAGLATLLAGRLPPLPTLIAAGAINLVLLAVMGSPPGSAIFLIATSLFGFLWLFAMPFQVPAVIAADPSRGAATLIGGAQLVGSSLGPFIAAMLVGRGDVSAVLWFGAACIGLSLTIMILAAYRHSGKAA